MDHINNQVAFPEIDVRQRLTVSTGYGVAEIVVHSGSSMVGQALRESGLRDRDISVLTLHRGAAVVPNPGGSRVLEDGDRLLCFGKLEEMRDLIPSRRRRIRRVRRLPKEPLPQPTD
ncbi:MAG: cation:proton antiporter regulatory subunit [Propioniciclava sp.]